MPCTYRGENGVICGANVGNKKDGTPYKFCRDCNSSYKNVRQTRTGGNLCAHMGNFPVTNLPYKCMAPANGTIKGFCVEHSKGKTPAPGDTGTTKPVKNIKDDRKNRAEKQLNRLDESEDFGMDGPILNDVKKAPKKTAKTAKKITNLDVESADDESNIETPSMKAVVDDKLEKKSSKSEKAALRASKEEKAAKKALKAEKAEKKALKAERKAIKEVKAGLKKPPALRGIVKSK